MVFGTVGEASGFGLERRGARRVEVNRTMPSRIGVGRNVRRLSEGGSGENMSVFVLSFFRAMRDDAFAFSCTAE